MTAIPMSKVKADLSRILDEVEALGEQVVITRSGRAVGVLLPVDEYEGLLETLEILADPELSAAIQRGLADVEAGEVVDHEEVWRGVDDPLRR